MPNQLAVSLGGPIAAVKVSLSAERQAEAEAVADRTSLEGEKNKQRYAEARTKLEQARALVTDRPI